MHPVIGHHMNKLYSKDIISNIKENLKKETSAFNSKPILKIINVGQNEPSLRYIGHKLKLAKEIGVDAELIQLDESTSQSEFLSKVDEINQDKSVDGLIIQLPLPNHLSLLNVYELIDPSKDVDGFGAQTLYNVYHNKECLFLPCTPMGILTLIDSQMNNIEGKNALILGRSHIVGKPLAQLLLNKNATLIHCHSKSDFKNFLPFADIIILATGNFGVLKLSQLKSLNQKILIIDVGMNKIEKNGVQVLTGDFEVDEEGLNLPNITYTPVPGGVGPMTVISLMQNVVKSYKYKMQKNKT